MARSSPGAPPPPRLNERSGKRVWLGKAKRKTSFYLGEICFWSTAGVGPFILAGCVVRGGGGPREGAGTRGRVRTSARARTV
jgi:hypothetical protein